ncbi:Atu4866 domain-containing protein [Rhodanobacter glycinis]|uniref:Atu4866 domain-containing protein n=1 Tax=Rhodanobacter glycinis TaxID=582702 RepID=UPI001C31B934|nr:Atu4866 domain-containing protein [Rhodanobacter glycinis]
MSTSSKTILTTGARSDIGEATSARCTRCSAYRGRLTLGGEHIGYVDDTGFAVDDDFVDGVLHRDGMMSYREW